MEVEWDAAKAEANVAKHGVRFDHAMGVFLDPHRREAIDDRRNYGEERRIVLGSIDGRVYVVAYTLRERRVRLISARKANPREQARYAALPT